MVGLRIFLSNMFSSAVCSCCRSHFDASALRPELAYVGVKDGVRAERRDGRHLYKVFGFDS